MKSTFKFETSDGFPKGFKQMTPGVFCKQTGESAANSIKESDFYFGEIVTSPEWGSSKRSGKTESTDMQIRLIPTFEEENPPERPKTFIKNLRESLVLNEINSNEIRLTSNTEKVKTDFGLDSLFEELILLLDIEGNSDPDFSFSNDKYEYVLNVIKKSSAIIITSVSLKGCIRTG